MENHSLSGYRNIFSNFCHTPVSLQTLHSSAENCCLRVGWPLTLANEDHVLVIVYFPPL